MPILQVWDILNYQCIQTFTDKTEYKPEDRLTCMAFDEEGPALVLGSSLLNVLPVSVKASDGWVGFSLKMGEMGGFGGGWLEGLTGTEMGHFSRKLIFDAFC